MTVERISSSRVSWVSSLDLVVEWLVGIKALNSVCPGNPGLVKKRKTARRLRRCYNNGLGIRFFKE